MIFDILMGIGLASVLSAFGVFDFLDSIFGFETRAEKIRKMNDAPWNKTHPWGEGWQERLAKRAKQVEPITIAKEQEARAHREQVKASMPQEKRDAQYMPEELRKKLGLV